MNKEAILKALEQAIEAIRKDEAKITEIGNGKTAIVVDNAPVTIIYEEEEH